MSIPKWSSFKYKKISDGIYLHKKLKQIEFDVPEILESKGFEATEENKDICMEVLRKVAKEIFPNVPIRETSIKDN